MAAERHRLASGPVEGFLDLSVYALPNLNSGTALLSLGAPGTLWSLTGLGCPREQGTAGEMAVLFKALKEAHSSIGRELFSTYHCQQWIGGGR